MFKDPRWKRKFKNQKQKRKKRNVYIHVGRKKEKEEEVDEEEGEEEEEGEKNVKEEKDGCKHDLIKWHKIFKLNWSKLGSLGPKPFQE